MIALMDIGNTRLKYTLLNVEHHEARDIAYDVSEVHTLNNHDLTEQWLENTFTQISNVQVTKVIVASVADEALTTSIANWCESKTIAYQQVVSERCKFGVTSAYYQPRQLGVDRWLALLGTQLLYPNQSAIIIDAGTATTIDVISAQGQHLGGWILAGIDILSSSLLSNTSQIKAEQMAKPALSFGLSSSDNVNNACWAATLGAIVIAVTQAKQQLPNLDKLIFTGGNAKALQQLCLQKVVDLPDSLTRERVDKLIFFGLQRYS